MTNNIKLPPLPERFNYTNSSGHWCYSRYTMVRDDLGDYVRAEDYDALRNASEALRAEVERLTEALRELEGREQRDEALLRKGSHPAITHCDTCGCDWLDNGLNPIGCPYCELRREVERRREARS